MTDVSVHELLSMVHTIPDNGPRPVQDPSGSVDNTGSVALRLPSAPPDANDQVKSTSSKGPRQQKPVSDGGHPRETQSRAKDHRIHRYSPLGVPKPSATARVQRMVERAQREFDQAAQSPPYHSKHARTAIPTPEAYKSVQMGYQNQATRS